ncbi:hypothetical protein [Nostoc sp.]|uniref:hypothetical protein n=1 Tax=Nostoc sp. TaxID=1180 RepID=UPI002FF5778D
MNNDGRQASARLGIVQRQKAGISSFINPSLASLTIPTLASPTRGFGLQTNNQSSNPKTN